MTIIYSIRLIYLVFLSNINLKRANIFFLKEGEFLFLIPLGILTLGSVFWGYLSKEIIWSFQIDVFSILSLKIKIFPILFCFIGLFGTIFFFFFFLLKFLVIPFR